MILFVSGRCDIPAHFSKWFFHRIHEGYVDVRNPFNTHQISRIMLTKENVDVIFFCTKNPIELLKRHREIPFPYYLHVSITPYHRDIEPCVINKQEIVQAFCDFSKIIGSKRMVLRYDPILINDKYSVEYHMKAFEQLLHKLQGATNTVIISFVDYYRNTKANMNILKLREMSEEEIDQLCTSFMHSAKRYGMKIQTCAEDINLQKYGIENKPCMSEALINDIVDCPISYKKGKGVRNNCDCLTSVDIGDYNACIHGCLYCYANYSQSNIVSNLKRHDEHSSLLLGQLSDEDKITIRKDYKKSQSQLF